MPDQSDAALMLRANVAAGAFNVALLDGVTGSGKTEVYFEAVAAALDQGKQVLILLPEIALTHAFLERFQERFGAKPGEWHSDLPPRMREKVWRQVAEGGVRLHPDTALQIAAEQERRSRPARIALVAVLVVIAVALLFALQRLF